MTPVPIPKLAEQITASKVLLDNAAHVSETLDKVSNWLSVGLGAALAMIVSNIDKLSAYLDVSHIKLAIVLYLAVLISALIGKRLSMAVLSSHRGAEVMRNALKDQDLSVFDLDFVQQQLIDATLKPRKWQVEKILGKARKKKESGDITWISRRIARVAQRQEWLTFLQMVLALCIILDLASGLK